MTIPIDWLEAQLEQANRGLEMAQQRYEEVQRLLQEAKKEVEAYSKVLEAAKIAERGEAKQTFETPTMNMPDHIEMILKKHGPLSLVDIFEILKQEGRPGTTKNSVGTQLNRNKPTRFLKNNYEQWYLTPK